MSLGGRDRQALDAIAGRLARSDPRLAGMMATFAELTSGQEMPAREKIAAAPRRLFERLGAGRFALLWLAIAVVLILVGLVASGGSKGTCPAWFPQGCAVQAFAHSAGAAGQLP
jgi:hypothetical protein